jgi:hypothetical protein
MKTTDLNVLRMAEAVIEVLKIFIAKLGSVPKLPQLYDELKTLVASHHLRNQQLVLGSAGTEVKQAKRKQLEIGADELLSTMLLYANMENVTELRRQVDVSRADITKAPGDIFLDTCNSLYQLALNLGIKLNGYLPEPTTLTTFKQQIDDFAAVLSAPRSNISARSATKKEMEKTISDIRSLLSDKMDMAMNIVQSREPEFFAAYTNARVIIDRHGKRRPTKPEEETQGMISGTLTDGTTNEPIADAIVQLQGIAEATTTDDDGTFAFDGINPGTHTLLCIMETYANLTITNIQVTAGDETEVEGKMLKA